MGGEKKKREKEKKSTSKASPRNTRSEKLSTLVVRVRRRRDHVPKKHNDSNNNIANLNWVYVAHSNENVGGKSSEELYNMGACAQRYENALTAIG